MKKIVLILGLSCLLLLVGEYSLKAQSTELKVERIGVKQGLSHGTVLRLFKDSRGFMWFGTVNGLNCYDGYNIKVFQHNTDDTTSISHNLIFGIAEDKQGNIWVGTIDGLNKFDPKTETFTRYKHNPNDPYSLTSNFTQEVVVDNNGYLWISTNGSGLNRFDPLTGKCKRFRFDAEDPESLASDFPGTIYSDQTNTIWIGSREGLNKYDPVKEKFKRYQHNPKNPKSLAHNQISCLFQDKKGTLWVGTSAGFHRFDRQKEEFTRYLPNPKDKNSLSYPKVTNIKEDESGNLWIATEGGGLNGFDLVTGIFTHHRHDPLRNESISSDVIPVLYKDSQGILWVGTDNGVNKINPFLNNFKTFLHNEKNGHSLKNKNIISVFEDKQENIWMGTEEDFYNLTKEGQFTTTHLPNFMNEVDKPRINSITQDFSGYMWLATNHGLWKYNRKSKQIKHFKNDPKDPSSLPFNEIWTIYTDPEGFLWLGTGGGGLVKFDPETHKFTAYTHDPENAASIVNNMVGPVFKDKEGVVWCGPIGGGLARLDPQTKKFTHYRNDPNDPNSINSNNIVIIFQDTKGRMWIGTTEYLCLFDQGTGKFKTYDNRHGIQKGIGGIWEDRLGNLWIVQATGVTSFNPENEKGFCFDLNDRFDGLIISPGDNLLSKKGSLYLGTNNGCIAFRIEDLQYNKYIPPVFITDFQIFNRPVTLVKGSPLKQHISLTKEIILPYDQSVFSFEFVALNYTLGQKNQYAYKMEGFDKDWNNIGTKRNATYTNLDPGIYTFRVKASNNDGVWNEEGASIKVTITPPFWKTLWFKLLVIFTVIGSAVTFYMVRMKAIQAQKAELERQVQERTFEVVQQKEEIQAQAEHLQNVNEHVMSSITYANTIQKAILPSASKIQAVLPESFILYRPKDVVSGDFYWFSHLPREEAETESDLTFLAVVDCTGHGVPGAFMSIIGNTLLNEIVNQKHIFDPATILDHLNAGVKAAVAKSEGVNTAGMDVCLIRLQRGEGNQVRLLYTGAKRPLFFVQKDNSHVEKLQGDRKSIGSESMAKVQFTSQELILESGAMLYLTSDGYVDQNNAKREKLGTAKLKQLISTSHHLSLAEQGVIFEKALDEHQQNTQQRDDITLIGLRV